MRSIPVFVMLALFSLGFGFQPMGMSRPIELHPESSSPSTSQSTSTPDLPAPQERRKDEQSEVINLRGELVNLDVVVVDRENRVYPDLEKTNFTVYENGVKQQLSLFNKEESPISLGLVIDTSKSMSKKLNKVIASAKSLIAQSHPGDEYFLIDFTTESELTVDFTHESKEVADALDDLVASGGTALLDAVYLAVGHAHQQGKFRRKAIVVITDGDERDSYYSRDKVLQSLKETDVQVFAIGFPENLDNYGYSVFKGTGETHRGKYEKRARRLLDDLAQVSGGRAFFPESLDQLAGIASTIAHELRTQYILGYYPTNTLRDGTWREVRVEVRSDKHQEKLIARTRPGYYASKEGVSSVGDPSRRSPKSLSKPNPH